MHLSLISSDKDNDLRCRVTKRANIIYGQQPSPQKAQYIEAEFRKRQMKRRGRVPSPKPDGLDGNDMYAGLINNPEFANIIMNLLVQKGVDSSGSEFSQIMEVLKSNPDCVRNFLPSAPGHTELQDQFSSATSELHLDQMNAFETAQSTHLELQSHLSQHGSIPMDPQIHEDIMTEHHDMLHSLPPPAPIPRIGMKIEDSIPSIPQPVPQATLPPISSPVQQITQIPAAAHPRPSQDRIRALGFPPVPGR